MTDTENIIALQAEIWDNILARNTKRLREIYPQDHLFRHVDGYYQILDEYLSTLASGTFRYYTYEPVKETVTFVDDSHAILHSRAKSDARIYGMHKVWRIDFKLGFKKVGGRWVPANEDEVGL
ncbi:putative uncharacterized protein [Streptococcus troglodytae]|uniref:DUF4440 domain-containing protein n=2 Tax=Streptococcus troglodytae TaxID=1111760 RepID=A0A1L7LK24_9STRE|nr:putative uncharacterized protein [Streptococcus troglodytae]